MNALRKTALGPTRSFSDVGSSPYQRRGADKPVSDRVVKNNPGHCQERFGLRCARQAHLVNARRITTWPAASTPWTWNTDLAMSRPIVVRPCAGLRFREGAAARLKGRVVHIWIP